MSLFHFALGAAEPRQPGYVYGPHGVGVREDLVQAVVEAWAGAGSGEAERLLADAAAGAGRSVDEVARIAAAAVAARLVGAAHRT